MMQLPISFRYPLCGGRRSGGGHHRSGGTDKPEISPCQCFAEDRLVALLRCVGLMGAHSEFRVATIEEEL